MKRKEENKIINFNDLKEEVLNKKYPNVSVNSKTSTTEHHNSNVALEEFQTVFVKYQEYLNAPDKNREVKLDEVLVYFNKYFDEIYKEFVIFDYDKVSKFKEAMDYAMLSSGKRLRPFLMFIAYNFAKGDEMFMLSPFMVAIEMIHTFSLIHDDLPCIDNDELRRGKPSVWKQYGEDIALLAGDALMMQAATILVEVMYEFACYDISPSINSSSLLIMKLAGLEGMIVGEVFDVMNTNNKKLTVDDINYMYDKKTTALLTASLLVGANMVPSFNKKMQFIEQIGYILGEAYQIQDDLLEIESTAEKIGKSISSDKDKDKITYVSKVGIKKAKERVNDSFMICMSIIDEMTNTRNAKEAKVFKDVIRYIMKRER